VELLRLPPIHITDLFVRLVPAAIGGSWGERAAVRPVATTARLTIPVSASGAIPIEAGRGRSSWPLSDLCLPSGAALHCHPGNGADRVTDRVGFREIAVAYQLLLNGEPVFLRASVPRG